MRLLLLSFLIFIAARSQAQMITRDSIAGEWICTNVTLRYQLGKTPKEKQFFQTMSNSFLNAQFTFRSDSIFSCKFSKEASPKMKELSFLNNKPWSFEPDSDLIRIGTLKENLMAIMVRQRNDSTTFQLYETPIVMLMKKKK